MALISVHFSHIIYNYTFLAKTLSFNPYYKAQVIKKNILMNEKVTMDKYINNFFQKNYFSSFLSYGNGATYDTLIPVHTCGEYNLIDESDNWLKTGHATGHATEHTIGHTPGHTLGHTIGNTIGHKIEHKTGNKTGHKTELRNEKFQSNKIQNNFVSSSNKTLKYNAD
ncbi:conserved protein, unknown function, partial [Hepatocystis sp. ex Piliocolobus tephrosceles]